VNEFSVAARGRRRRFASCAAAMLAMLAVLALAVLTACTGPADASESEARAMTAEDWANRFVEDKIKIYNEAEYIETAIIDSKITLLEKADTFDALLAYPVELWRLEYRLKPEDISKFVLAGGADEEDGWITEASSMGRPFLVLSYEDAAPQYLGCLWNGESDLTTPAGRETALRVFLEDAKLLPCETFAGNHILVKFPLSTGETCQVLLSQPAVQGDGGLWCAERWMDGNGYVYYITPQTADSRAAEYYAALQVQCDAGHNPGLLDPLDVALTFVVEELGQHATLGDLTAEYDARAEDFYETPVSAYIGYISNFKTDDMFFYLDKIEWLTDERDADRLRALGIEPESLPNGFYIHNPASYPDWFEVSEQTRYEIIDPGEAEHRNIDAQKFAEHLAQFPESPPPFHVVTKDGYVQSIVEQYVP
jgi:hypothetical protein